MDERNSWHEAVHRVNEMGDSDLSGKIAHVHMSMFDDLRKSGHMIHVKGKLLSTQLHNISADERLDIAFKIGRANVTLEKVVDNTGFDFTLANVDIVPYCTFAAFVAMLEELNMGEDITGLDDAFKRTATCRYETADRAGGEIKPLLDLLPQIFPRLTVDIAYDVIASKAEQGSRYVHFDEMGTIMELTQVTPVSTMRMGVSGIVRKGRVRKNDLMILADGTGRVLCPPSSVMAIYKNYAEIEEASEGDTVDELSLAAEIPAGEYTGLVLVAPGNGIDSGDSGGASNSEARGGNTSKGGFFGKLFGKER